MNARRILILAPHPDDEVVACGAWARRKRRAGVELFVLHLTTGVPGSSRRYDARVARRRQEAVRVAETLGLTIVGFGDAPSRTLHEHLIAAHERVVRALERHAIDGVWVPAYEGGHADHDAANCLVATLAGRVAAWEFAEYNFAGGQVRSHEFPARTGEERELTLDAREADVKRSTLAMYASERMNLRHIGVRRECARPLAVYDYGAPPHPGRLFYERFQWVPIPLARVDFTRSQDVCAELRSFTRAAEAARGGPAAASVPGRIDDAH